jgi:hypothetical protein
MDSAALIWNNHESKQKATCVVLKWAHLGIENAGGNFKQKAAQVHMLCHNVC